MIGFAHRGAPSAGIRENTLAAFTRALELGATALESDVWLSSDGIAVLDHDGVVSSRLRRRPIAALPVSALPKWIPTLNELYARSGADFELCLDVKDPAAAPPTIEVAKRHGADSRLWLCGSVAQVRSWRPAAGVARLAVSTSLRARGQLRAPAEERIDEAADAGADALNLRAPEWSPERVKRCHDRRMLVFAWDVQQRRTLETMREYGCDAIFSDFLSLLNAA